MKFHWNHPYVAPLTSAKTAASMKKDPLVLFSGGPSLWELVLEYESQTGLKQDI